MWISDSYCKECGEWGKRKRIDKVRAAKEGLLGDLYEFSSQTIIRG
jgi:hypothetical protein